MNHVNNEMPLNCCSTRSWRSTMTKAARNNSSKVMYEIWHKTQVGTREETKIGEKKRNTRKKQNIPRRKIPVCDFEATAREKLLNFSFLMFLRSPFANCARDFHHFRFNFFFLWLQQAIADHDHHDTMFLLLCCPESVYFSLAASFV